MVTVSRSRPIKQTTTAATAKSERDRLNRANRAAPIDARQLGRWLVSHVVSAYPIEVDGLELATRIGEVYVYRNTFAPDVALTWDGPNRVTIQAGEPYTGELYAVAGGRWRDQDALPGLPGAVDKPAQTWTYEYDASEITLSLLVAGLLLAGAAAVWWGLIRE